MAYTMGPHATPAEAGSGPVFLGIKNVTEQGRLDFSEVRHLSEENYTRWTRRVTPQANDIVFSYEATLHRYGLIPEGFRGCLGRRMALIRPDTRKIVPRFLHYYLLGGHWRSIVESNVIRGATVDRIPLTKFPDFEVRIPDISTQRRIVSILSVYDDLIENNGRRVRLLEQSAWLIYNEWFGHFRYPGYEHAATKNGVPDGWTSGVIRDLGEIVTGKTPSKKVASYYGTNLPFIKIPDMHGNSVVTKTDANLTTEGAGSQAAKMLHPRSILVSCIGTVGVVAFNASLAQTNQKDKSYRTTS